MLEFLASHGIDLAAIVAAATAIAGSITAICQVIKQNKIIRQNNNITNSEIKITREGIVEAFKTAKIPTEWKISISNQVNQILVGFREDFIKLYKENANLTNRLVAISAKILSFTAASKQLSEEEKKQLNDLVLLLSTEDYTIDITQ